MSTPVIPGPKIVGPKMNPVPVSIAVSARRVEHKVQKERAKRVRKQDETRKRKQSRQEEKSLQSLERRLNEEYSDAEDVGPVRDRPECPPVVKLKFGPVVRLSLIRGYNVRWHESVDEEGVRALLKSRSMLTACLWTLFHRVSNTKTGQCALFPATLANAEEGFPVFIMVWSLLREVMALLYTGFTRSKNRFDKKKIQQSFEGVTVQGLSRDDLLNMHVVTGCWKLAKARVMDEGHFAVSAHFMRLARRVLEPYKSPTDLFYQNEEVAVDARIFCSDRYVTVEQLKDWRDRELSSVSVLESVQSKYTDWSVWRFIPPLFSALTPCFGLPYWPAILSAWDDVWSFWGESSRGRYQRNCYGFYDDVVLPVSQLLCE